MLINHLLDNFPINFICMSIKFQMAARIIEIEKFIRMHLNDFTQLSVDAIFYANEVVFWLFNQ